MSDTEKSAQEAEIFFGQSKVLDAIIPIESPERNENTDTERAVSCTVSAESPVSNETPDMITKPKGFDVELDFEGETIGEKKTIDSIETTEELSDEEDGEIPGEIKKTEKNKVDKDVQDDDDDGEISDDEELEEGELNEKETGGEPGGGVKQPARQICRFFNKGRCTFGNVCRFLHLTNSPGERGNYNMFSNTRHSPVSCQGGSYFGSAVLNLRSAPPRHDYFIPPPVLPMETEIETAWARGLSKAKELVKKASIRKETSPDFKEKHLNLSLSGGEALQPTREKEFDKENIRNEKKKRERQNDFYPKYREDEIDREYENFEIRYTNRDREKPRSMRRQGSPSLKGEKFPKGSAPRRTWGNDVFTRKNAEKWIDPYRRSKSPKGRRSRSHTRSGSYSTVSSYSYRSSLSRSSSGSSYESSRSPSPMEKRKSSPFNQTVLSPSKGSQNRFLTKKKSGGSRSSSPGSITMDSITSSSSDSLDHHVSSMKKEEKSEETTRTNMATSSKIFEELQFLKDKKTEIKNEDPDDMEFLTPEKKSVPAFPSLKHLLPNLEKEPVSKGPHQKQQIKLTLLNNKNQGSKFVTQNLPKELDAVKAKEIDGTTSGVKRPLSPPRFVVSKSTPALIPKKSARRDELLKQLKAVEDAIARKRAKFC